MSVALKPKQSTTKSMRRVRNERNAEITWFLQEKKAEREKKRMADAGHKAMQEVIDFLEDSFSSINQEIPLTLVEKLEELMRGTLTKNKIGMINFIAEGVKEQMPDWRENALRHFGFEALI